MSERKKMFALVILAVIGMLVFVSLLGSYTTTLDAFEMRMELMIFDSGFTELALPPLGKVRARTHAPPLMLRVTLTNINLDQLQVLLDKVEDEKFLDGLRDASRRQINVFLLRLLVLAFLGGLAGPFLFGERERKRLLAAGLIGMLLLGTLLTASYVTYDPLAFLNPEFEGILQAAPWMFGLLEETLVKVRSLGEQLGLIATNISVLFEQVEQLEPGGTVEGELKVAHVSDLHNNPAGMDFLRQVVRTFGVHLVIDTGDITDFGTEIEAGLAAPIEEFDIPYIFVPGNHDSPDVVARMKSFANVLVLEEGIVDVFGLRIAGIADPSSRDTGMVVAADYILEDYAARLERVLNEAEDVPHIVAVHHPRIAGHFMDRVRVVLTGHTHRLGITESSESVMINAGTTGASGIRGLQTNQETPFSLVLLHFGRQADGEFYLKATDIIKVFQLQSGFLLERRLFGTVAQEREISELEYSEE
ncbi:MAG: metallophosphoesterase family protein [Bacillota bacterium]|nr:metallophosphoesterase family protein [Bacillota bacterium]MDW7684610.1 metallophosphoesterase family protein [Bacillota bacterium]